MVNKKNILVTGSKGQLGQAIKNIAHNFLNYNFYFKDKAQLNITKFDLLYSCIEENEINIIINCAAYTNVEKAEKERDIANMVNHIAVDNISKICKKKKIQLIHISTDYVFDGLKISPYNENDKPNPISYYGKSKLKGERKMMSHKLKNSAIIRTSWLYSMYAENFLLKILSNIKSLDSFSVVNDEHGSPTNANDLAELILKILPKLENDTEIYHFSNLGFCSRINFANQIKEYCKENVTIKPKQSDNDNNIRPRFSALDSSKIINKFGLNIDDWSSSLRNMLQIEKVYNTNEI